MREELAQQRRQSEQIRKNCALQREAMKLQRETMKDQQASTNLLNALPKPRPPQKPPLRTS